MIFKKYVGTSMKPFFRELYHDINEDDIFNGAAALSYYLLLSLFPAMIFLLSILPYLPVENLNQAIMAFINQALPKESATLLYGVVDEVTAEQSTSLLSFGAIATIWASSTGLYAIMQLLNKTYKVVEQRPFWKARGIAILMTFVFGIIIISAFALIVFGGFLQDYLIGQFGYQSFLIPFFTVFRWIVIAFLLLLGFSVIYYYGPNVEQDFKFITPGSILGTILLAVASLGMQYYVQNLADYAATYGSIGAVIILMLYLYIAGLVILLGSEVNALVEHHSPNGKNKGERIKNQNENAKRFNLGPRPDFANEKPEYNPKSDPTLDI